MADDVHGGHDGRGCHAMWHGMGQGWQTVARAGWRVGRSGGIVMQQNGTDLIMADAARKRAGCAVFLGLGMGAA
ncbi:hypothetical protein LV478_08750 [Komagataeibacter oboediens]|uniref:hypothetical protein n=1 Tax=Komagataeibacter TaxID=1434011 RepID=UPI000237EC38|nr:hypothetical protein [Komagataeibacter oboediens]WEQ53564.1 hypothetical protein LV478_08750 [Komagataeibacter oboediens]